MSEPHHEATIRLFPYSDGSGHEITVRLVGGTGGREAFLTIEEGSSTIAVNVSQWADLNLAVVRLVDFMEEAQRFQKDAPDA